MKPITKTIILKLFKDAYDKIESDTCSLDDDEIIDIANMLTHRKLNIEQTCNYLNTSRATLNRMIIDGRIPPARKDTGGNKYWYQDELDVYIEANKHK